MSTDVYPRRSVLIVDDEEFILDAISEILKSKGIDNIITCADSREVMAIMQEQEVELVLLDLMMPYITGNTLLLEIVRDLPDVPVIILTGLNDLSTAVECMRSGAFDYMVKAVEESRLTSGVRKAIEIRELKQEYSNLKHRLLDNRIENREALSEIITRNAKMRSIFLYMESIAGTSHPVLITGETGTGKGLIAEAIHTLSKREGDYVAVNISGFDDTMFTDTLFGHRKGAFTSASEKRAGLVAKAAGGTFFLDEIGNLSVSSQTKLVRLLEEGE